jgi:hypothetical protein
LTEPEIAALKSELGGKLDVATSAEAAAYARELAKMPEGRKAITQLKNDGVIEIPLKEAIQRKLGFKPKEIFDIPKEKPKQIPEKIMTAAELEGVPGKVVKIEVPTKAPKTPVKVEKAGEVKQVKVDPETTVEAKLEPEVTQVQDVVLIKKLDVGQNKLESAIEKHGFGGISKKDQHPEVVEARENKEKIQGQVYEILNPDRPIGTKVIYNGKESVLVKAEFDVMRSADIKKEGQPSGRSYKPTVKIDDGSGEIPLTIKEFNALPLAEVKPKTVGEVQKEWTPERVKEFLSKKREGMETNADLLLETDIPMDVYRSVVKELGLKPIGRSKWDYAHAIERHLEKKPAETQAIKEAVNILREIDPEVDYQVRLDELRTVQDAILDPKDPATPEHILASIQEAGSELAGVEPVDIKIAGQNYQESRDGTLVDVIKLYKGADLGTVAHERIETWYKQQEELIDGWDNKITEARKQYHEATESGSATGVWTMRLVRNQQGRSLQLSSESLKNSENTSSISGKVPIGLLSMLKKAKSRVN